MNKCETLMFSNQDKFGLENELRVAIQASLDAGKEIEKVYESDFTVEVKDDQSPLTIADKKANQVINSYLEKTKIPVISEENRQIPYEVRKHWDSCWIVDPLDGTKEFVKRNGEFTVNIALVLSGRPVLGVIYVPIKKVLYIGNILNKKSYKVLLDSHDSSIEDVVNRAIRIYKKENVSNIVHVVGSRSHMNEDTVKYIERLKKSGKQVELISRGSSLKFCMVAEGVADVYPRFAPTMEWDTAAGQAVCNAVGIQVMIEETEEELLYNKEVLLNPWFICS